MNYCFFIIFILLILIIILLTLIKKNKDHFDPGEAQQDESYEIFEDNVKIGEIISNNTDEPIKYIVEPNPLFPDKIFKMIKMKTDYTFTYNRVDDLDKELTFSLYLRPDFGDLSVFDNFIKFDDTNNNIKSELKLHNIDNHYQLSIKLSDFNNQTISELQLNSDKFTERLSFMAIMINNNEKYIDIYFNGQNKRLVYTNNIEFKPNEIKIQNYNGDAGKILIWNDLLDMNSDLCKRFDCKLNCFILNGDPYDNDVNECIKACHNKCKKDEGDITSLKKCQEMCIDCKMPDEEEWTREEKIEKCPWYSEIKLLDKNVPDAPKIRGFAGDGKITLEWLKPNDGRLKILRYIVLVYETFNRDRGAIINISNDPNCKICEHIITDLKNQTHYDVIVQAVNSQGISEKSNIITIVPNGSNIHDEIQSMFDEFDKNLDAKLKNKIIDDCDNKSFNNNEDYILDHIGDEIDIEKVIKDNNIDNIYRPKFN